MAETTDTAAANKTFYDRDLFIEKWAKIFKCQPNAFAVAAELVNKNKNFQSASSVLFGLSFKYHKEWLVKCAEYWQNAWKGFGSAQCTAEWCVEFQKHYVTEVAKYPADA